MTTAQKPGTTAQKPGDTDPVKVAQRQMQALSLVNAGNIRGAAQRLRELIDVVLGWDRTEPGWAVTIQTVLTGFAALAVDCGRGRDVHQNGEAWLAILRPLGDRGHVSALRLNMVEALMHDGLYERAHDVLALEPVAALRPNLVPVHTRLQHKLDGLLNRPDEPLIPIDGALVLRQTLEYLREHRPDTRLTEELEAGGTADLERRLAEPAFPPVPEDLGTLDQASLHLLEAKAPLGALQAVSQGMLGALQNPGSPETYWSVVRVADRAGAAAEAFGYWEIMITASWMATVALRRAGAYLEALIRLQGLAMQIEARRRLIKNPRLRAAIAVYLPHLPWVIAGTAVQAGQGAIALWGMEAAKARILGDLRRGAPPAAATPDGLLNGLRTRLSACPRTHLLTFLSDTAADASTAGQVGIRALLLTARGALHTAEIPLADAVVRAAADLINRLVRVGPKGGTDLGEIFNDDPWRRPFEPHLAALAPLFAWLDPLLKRGAMQVGDTLVVSADGSIHNIPLGMLPFAGKSLIDSFAVVSMPSLSLLLEPPSAGRPDEAVALLGPTPFERQQQGKTFEDDVTALAALLPTTTLASIEDCREVLQAPAGRLLHFATHGTFSRTAPLRSGGLILANRHGAYDPSDGAFIVTPEQLGGSDLTGVHLTIRACLVGQVQQITSREALGAVWALLSAGATTVLAASWTVEATSAARWCNYFYYAWLGRGQTRAEAARTASLALRAEGGAYAHPCHWAPFVLYAGSLGSDVA